MSEARQRGHNRSKSEWTKLINDCYSSGLTIHQWCRENDISHHTFYKVIKRFRAEACDQLDPHPSMLKEGPVTGYHQDVVPIQILSNDKSSSKEMYTEESIRNGSMKITVGNTIIEVTNGFDKSLLECALRTIGGALC